MATLIGMAVVFGMVFGGYLLAGGKLDIILYTLPFEMMMIGGAALGAFIISNGLGPAAHMAKDSVRAFKGPRWKPSDYRDLLCLLFELLRLSRSDPAALERHIEEPGASEIFQRYGAIAKDGESVDLIADTMRAAQMNYDDPHQVEEVLDKRIEALIERSLHSSHAFQVVADGLPALGIVAAVLGVIKTMGAIDQPPEVLGKLIGGALVGTFLGVFIAYGFIGPLAGRLRAISEDDARFHLLIREVLVANLHSHPPDICIEVGRQIAPAGVRPSFGDLEADLRNLRAAA